MTKLEEIRAKLDAMEQRSLEHTAKTKQNILKKAAHLPTTTASDAEDELFYKLSFGTSYAELIQQITTVLAQLNKPKGYPTFTEVKSTADLHQLNYKELTEYFLLLQADKAEIDKYIEHCSKEVFDSDTGVYSI